jgi:hypothetical protein
MARKPTIAIVPMRNASPLPDTEGAGAALGEQTESTQTNPRAHSAVVVQAPPSDTGVLVAVAVAVLVAVAVAVLVAVAVAVLVAVAVAVLVTVAVAVGVAPHAISSLHAPSSMVPPSHSEQIVKSQKNGSVALSEHT